MPDEGMRIVPRGARGARRPPTGPARRRAGDPRDARDRPRRRQRPARLRRRLRRVGSHAPAARPGRRRDRPCWRAGTPPPTEDGAGDVDRLPARARPTRPRSAPTTPISSIADLQGRTGGTFSDRMLALWAESFVRTQQGAPDARGADRRRLRDRDRDRRAARARDRRAGPLEGARARSEPTTPTTRPTTADHSLEALGLTADGWSRIFDLALADVSGSLVTTGAAPQLIEHEVAGVTVGEGRHAGRHLAAGHDVSHHLGEAAHRHRRDRRRPGASAAVRA